VINVAINFSPEMVLWLIVSLGIAKDRKKRNTNVQYVKILQDARGRKEEKNNR
jgi:hypothetical protein